MATKRLGQVSVNAKRIHNDNDIIDLPVKEHADKQIWARPASAEKYQGAAEPLIFQQFAIDYHILPSVEGIYIYI